jgi:hypothetical protein
LGPHPQEAWSHKVLQRRQFIGKKYFTASGISLLAGIAIYFLFRNTNMLLFDWFESIRWLNRFYFPLNTKDNRALAFFVYTLPDGLWLLSGLLFIRGIWHGNTNLCRTYIVIFCVIAVAFEMLQASTIIPGTFDALDLLFLGFTAFVESAIYKYFIMRRKT